jgi:MFS family permease
MLDRFNRARKEYPGQFFLLFVGMLISTIGSSMIWPFIMIYVSKKLTLPLTQIASLMTMNAIMGLIFSFIAGPITDRLGRKWVMVVSLLGTGLTYLYMSAAGTFLEFAVTQCFMGALSPLYRVGADAMMADLIPAEKRPDAYSLMRMSNNAGVSIGPAIGGIIATQSYTVAFYLAAAGMIFYSILLAVRAKETLPASAAVSQKGTSLFNGYGRIFKDREFIGFVSAFTLTSMLASLVWILLPVYANTNYHVPESQYGFIPTTNAIMVVAFQFLVSLVTQKFRPLPVMMVGTAFYAIATAAVVLFAGFWGFWACMVVMTIGELILIPTASTFTANIAPTDKRGRYMSIFGLTWSIAFGMAPILGGFLNDQFNPHAIWYGGAVIGAASILAFLYLHKRYSSTAVPKPLLSTDEQLT